MATDPQTTPGADRDPLPTRLIPEVFAAHLEEAQFLFEQRREGTRSAEFLVTDLAEFDARLAAHLDGLVLAEEAEVELLQELLAGDEPAEVCTATAVLLRLPRPDAAEIVLKALSSATGGQLEGILQAMCHGPIESITASLQQALATGETLFAAAAGLVLAWQNSPDLQTERIRSFLSDPDPEVRRIGWRTAISLPPPQTRQLLGS